MHHDSERSARLMTSIPSADTTRPTPTGYNTPRPHAVLVLAGRESTASVLSTFVSRSGHTAATPLDDEGLDQALARVRPRAIIIDFEHPSAASARTDRQIAGFATRVLLCSAWHRSAEARPRAAAMGSLYFSLPIEHKDFDLLLKTALLL
jgi:hypothetical protein